MADRLSLNPTKSNYLIIPSKLRETTSQIYLYLNNVPLSTSKSVKHLGVCLDSQLNFHDHIIATEHKITRAVRIMSKLFLNLPWSNYTTLWFTSTYYKAC